MTESKSQTLITGVYRTGSEYIANLINCHPQIIVTMYSVNMMRFIYNRYNPISEKSNFEAALDDLNDRLQMRYHQSLNKAKLMDAFAGCERLDYGFFYDAVVCSLYMKYPAEHWAEKNQLLWREIPIFLDLMPNGKAILIIRDPRSVLLSFKSYTYAPPPAYIGAVFNSLDAMQYGLRYQQTLPNDRFCCIRYEDVARNPEKVTAKIWQFLNLDGLYDISDQTSWKDAYGQPWHTNSSFHDNSDQKPFDVEASINRWRSGLSAEEIALVEGVCEEAMIKFGYTLSKANADWLSVASLFLQNDTMTNYFKHWLSSGEGIEAFPTDPLDEKNWRNAQEDKYLLKKVKNG